MLVHSNRVEWQHTQLRIEHYFCSTLNSINQYANTNPFVNVWMCAHSTAMANIINSFSSSTSLNKSIHKDLYIPSEIYISNLFKLKSKYNSLAAFKCQAKPNKIYDYYYYIYQYHSFYVFALYDLVPFWKHNSLR